MQDKQLCLQLPFSHCTWEVPTSNLSRTLLLTNFEVAIPV